MALGPGAADIRIDMGAALAMAQAEGCDPAIAAALLRQVQWGMTAAQMARRERDGK